MKLLIGDFETFFRRGEYSLTGNKLTTEEYIRDPRFRAHGIGIEWWNGFRKWYSHDELPALFASIDWSDICFLSHHAHFDALILAHHYGVQPARVICTIAMANVTLPHRKKSLGSLAEFFGLPDKNVPYNLFNGVYILPPHIERDVAAGCLHDVYLNKQIFVKMCAGVPELDVPRFPQSEFEPMSATIKMFTDPILNIDVPRADALSHRIVARKAAMLKELATSLYGGQHFASWPDADIFGYMRTQLASREAFADMLRALGQEPPVKQAKDKPPGTMTYAFAKSDPGMKAMLEDDSNPYVQAICEAKLSVNSTIGETRSRRFADTQRRGAAVPVYLKWSSTFSNRTGGGDKMNWSNLERLPNKDEQTGEYELGADGHVRKGEIRLCVKSPPGYVIVVIDLAQIEARMLAYNAGQWDIVEDFRRGADIYSNFIQPYYGRPISKNTPSERGVGKQLVLSCLSPTTPVLTSAGLRRIVDVRSTDLLWDGVEWVRHSGLVDHGTQPTMKLANIRLTADHLILTEDTWTEAHELQDESAFSCARDTAKGLLPFMPDYRALSRMAFHPSDHVAQQVYDLVLAGPRNRFTILTDRGPLIVHNCGYMAGGPTIKTTAALGSYGPPVHLTLDEAEKLKTYYRTKNWAIPNYWKQADEYLPVLANGGTANWGPMRIEGHRIWGPGGVPLDYTTLRQVPALDTDPDWKKAKPQWAMKTVEGFTRIHKGIVTAHVTSFLSRLVMTDALALISRRYKCALTCYDEIALCVRAEEAVEARDYAMEIMQTPPWWLPDLPVKAEAGIDTVYSK